MSEAKQSGRTYWFVDRRALLFHLVFYVALPLLFIGAMFYGQAGEPGQNNTWVRGFGVVLGSLAFWIGLRRFTDGLTRRLETTARSIVLKGRLIKEIEILWTEVASVRFERDCGPNEEYGRAYLIQGKDKTIEIGQYMPEWKTLAEEMRLRSPSDADLRGIKPVCKV